MVPQYLAGGSLFYDATAAFPTQARHFGGAGCLSAPGSAMIPADRHVAVITLYEGQPVPLRAGLPGSGSRRRRCRRASRACWPCAWLPLWPLAHSLRKNSSLSSPSPSRWSRATPANTSKTGTGLAGPRLSLRLAPSLRPAPLAGGRAVSGRGTGLKTDPVKLPGFGLCSQPWGGVSLPEVEKCIDLTLFWPSLAFRSGCRPVAGPRLHRRQFMLNPFMANMTAPARAMVAVVSADSRWPAPLAAPSACRMITSASPIRPDRAIAAAASPRREPRRRAEAAGQRLAWPERPATGGRAVSC